jgi:uncharacterized protein (DUF433 family)
MNEKFYTAAEAAAIANLPLHVVNRVIETHILRLHRVRHGKKRFRRLLTAWQLVYLRLEAEGARLFSKALRREVARALESDPAADVLNLPDCPALAVHVKNARRHVELQLDLLHEAQDIVVFNPDIKDGTLVFRGTEVPVEQVAPIVSRGARTEEILAQFPALSHKQADLAPLYLAAYPRMGRPRGSRRPRRRPFTGSLHLAGPAGSKRNAKRATAKRRVSH